MADYWELPALAGKMLRVRGPKFAVDRRTDLPVDIIMINAIEVDNAASGTVDPARSSMIHRSTIHGPLMRGVPYLETMLFLDVPSLGSRGSTRGAS